MSPRPLCIALFIAPIAALAQKPAINPGGVVNAASYTAGPDTGSIASIFGTNLAATTQTANTIPLPRQLAGTSVSVDGIAAPLFYVSPTQINFQMPSPGDTTARVSSAPGVVVATAAGQSEPYQLPPAIGVWSIFTRDSSGCGQADVLNVNADGSTSINSSSDSAAPGQFISIYGTGGGDTENVPPDGTPAPSTPPLGSAGFDAALFDFYIQPSYSALAWSGLAPGLIGVDQFNVAIPPTVREGCAVPLQIQGENFYSRPVTISIGKSGGACVDPPEAGYGQVTWEKTVTTAPQSKLSETDVVTVSLQASPGKQPPTPPIYTEYGGTPQLYVYLGGPACPIPGYRSLRAGTITVAGPGLSPVHAAVLALQSPTVFDGTNTNERPTSQSSGLTIYQATLPAGAIKPGSFTVTASGGDVAAFQSTVQIGPPINISTSLAGQTINQGPPFVLNWTGGDPDSWVILLTASPVGGPYTHYGQGFVGRASDGSLTVDNPPGIPPAFGVPFGPTDMIVQVVPDPSIVPSFSTPGLSLGGQNLWRYTYIFQGVILAQK